MTLIKIEPFRNFELYDDKVRDYLKENLVNFNYTLFPKIDISEDEKNIYIDAEIPGVKKEEINLLLENNTLTLKGEKKLSDDFSKRKFCRSERVYGSFNRSFTLPDDINIDSASAKFENGLLKISFQKSIPERSKERQIQVK